MNFLVPGIMLGWAALCNSDLVLKALYSIVGETGFTQEILQEYFCDEPGHNDYKASESHNFFLFVYYVVRPLTMVCHWILCPCFLRISSQEVPIPSTQKFSEAGWIGLRGRLLVGMQHFSLHSEFFPFPAKNTTKASNDA